MERTVRFSARNVHLDAASKIWDVFQKHPSVSVTHNEEAHFKDKMAPLFEMEATTDDPEAFMRAVRDAAKEAGIAEYELT